MSQLIKFWKVASHVLYRKKVLILNCNYLIVRVVGSSQPMFVFQFSASAEITLTCYENATICMPQTQIGGWSKSPVQPERQLHKRQTFHFNKLRRFHFVHTYSYFAGASRPFLRLCRSSSFTLTITPVYACLSPTTSFLVIFCYCFWGYFNSLKSSGEFKYRSIDWSFNDKDCPSEWSIEKMN